MLACMRYRAEEEIEQECNVAIPGAEENKRSRVLTVWWVEVQMVSALVVVAV